MANKGNDKDTAGWSERMTKRSWGLLAILIMFTVTSCAAAQPGTREYCYQTSGWCDLNCPQDNFEGRNIYCKDNCRQQLDECLKQYPK